MAKQKDKPADEKYGDLIISNMKLQSFEADLANQKCKNFDCSGNFFKNLAFAPGLVTGDFICKNNKKISGELNPMNQFHLGAGRFFPYDGSEDEDVNRPVKVNGSYITDENVYKKPKIYDASVGLSNESDASESNVPGIHNPNLVRFSTVTIMTNIKSQPILAFELKGLPEFEARGQYGYGSWGNGKPVHGWFNLRVSIKGPHKVGSQITYAGAVPQGGYLGWDAPPYNLKNFINWSYFQSLSGGGRGSEMEYNPFGRGQPNGTTIYKGKQYGNKTSSRTYAPTYYYLNGDPIMKRIDSGKLYKALPGRTLEVADPKKDIASNINDIRVSVTGATTLIENNSVQKVHYSFSGKHPIFGQLDDGTYFAGYAVNLITSADKILNYFNKKGKKVLYCDGGDGGGSTTLVVDSKMVEPSEPQDARPVAVVIGW